MELITSKNKNGFEGKLIYRENLGSDVFLHLSINEGDQKIIVRSEPSMVVNSVIGDSIMVGWDEQKVMVFDENGKNMTMK